MSGIYRIFGIPAADELGIGGPTIDRRRRDDQRRKADAADVRVPIRTSKLPVLLVHVSDSRIVEASEPLAALFGGKPSDLVGRTLREFAGDALATLARVGAGDIDGYRRSRRSCRRIDGSEFTADLWLSAHTDPPHESAIGVVIPRGGEATFVSTAGHEEDLLLVMGTVDADWSIDRISADVQSLLGFAPTTIIGVSVLAGIHPLDVPALLTAVGHASVDMASSSVRLRVLRSDGTWQRCRAVLSPHGRAERPPFSFALVSSTEPADPVLGLAGQLRHIAREVVIADTSRGLTRMATAHVVPLLAELSSRELEIVARLLLGDRVPLIARTLFLGESTVRNHLTSVYRKLGVSSQQGLITVLRSAPVERGTGGSV